MPSLPDINEESLQLPQVLAVGAYRLTVIPIRGGSTITDDGIRPPWAGNTRGVRVIGAMGIWKILAILRAHRGNVGVLRFKRKAALPQPGCILRYVL